MVTWDWAPRASRGKGWWALERLSRRILPVSPKLWSPSPWRSCFVCLLPAAGLHPLTLLNSPCREKVSWALSFHLCQPPPAPLLNEGHFKYCFSLIPPSWYCCRATPLLVLCLSSPPAQPLSALTRWEGLAASLGQLLPLFSQTTPLLPMEWSSSQHHPAPSSVSAAPPPLV